MCGSGAVDAVEAGFSTAGGQALRACPKFSRNVPLTERHEGGARHFLTETRFISIVASRARVVERRAMCGSGAVAAVEAGFEAALEGFEGEAHTPVEDGGGEVQGEWAEGGGDDFLGGQHQLGDGDDGDQRGVLDQADQGVAHGWHRHPQRLRQDDVAEGLPVAEAQAETGAPLAGADAGDRAP